MDIQKRIEWNKEHTRQIGLRLCETTDADIIAYLDTLPNKQGYIKQLIRADMGHTRPLFAVFMSADDKEPKCFWSVGRASSCLEVTKAERICKYDVPARIANPYDAYKTIVENSDTIALDS